MSDRAFQSRGLDEWLALNRRLTADADLEARIARASDRMAAAEGRSAKLAAWRELVRLIDQRSPEQIERMERARGLPRAARDIPLTGSFLHRCPMSGDQMIDEHDKEILACRCYSSSEFFAAQDRIAVDLDAQRSTHHSENHQMPTKGKLLRKYSERTPIRFIQIDGFGPEQCDSVIADCGGYGMTGGTTHELMSGYPKVRILIVPGTDPALVSKILSNAIEFYPGVKSLQNEALEELLGGDAR